MAVDWNESEENRVGAAITAHPVDSSRCAAVARVVFAVGQERDDFTRGRQIKPRGRAPFLVVKNPRARFWESHTYVETHRHSVDALTGSAGCEHTSYLETHFDFVEELSVRDVDVETIDPGIEDDL